MSTKLFAFRMQCWLSATPCNQMASSPSHAILHRSRSKAICCFAWARCYTAPWLDCTGPQGQATCPVDSHQEGLHLWKSDCKGVCQWVSGAWLATCPHFHLFHTLAQIRRASWLNGLCRTARKEHPSQAMFFDLWAHDLLWVWGRVFQERPMQIRLYRAFAKDTTAATWALPYMCKTSRMADLHIAWCSRASDLFAPVDVISLGWQFALPVCSPYIIKLPSWCVMIVEQSGSFTNPLSRFVLIISTQKALPCWAAVLHSADINLARLQMA